MKRTRLLTLAFALLLLWVLGLSSKVQAQFAYTATGFGTNQNNPISPIGATQNTQANDHDLTGWTTILGPNVVSNQWSANQTIPFTFRFYNTHETQFKVSCNGVLTFDVASTGVPLGNAALPAVALNNRSIACFWDTHTALDASAQVAVRTFGTAPNRQLWIKWNNANRNAVRTTNAIVLEESTNRIYIVDMYGTGALTSTVGIQLNNTTGQGLGPGFNHGALTTANTDNRFYILTPRLEGDYNVGNATADFLSPAQAQRVAEICGLSGNTRMNIITGTYNEQISVNPIPNAAATRTLTYRAASGNRSDVLIAWPSSTLVTANFVVQFLSASFVTFRDLSLARTGSNVNAHVVTVEGTTPSFINLINLNITTDGGPSAPSQRSGIRLLATNFNSITIDSVTISSLGGGYSSTNTVGTTLQFLNSTITTQLQSAVQIQNVTSGFKMERCTLQNNSTAQYAAVISGGNGVEIFGNQINNANGSGLQLQGLSGSVFNNIVRTQGNSAAFNSVHLLGCLSLNFDYNTLYNTHTVTTSNAILIDGTASTPSINFRNNIFASFGGARALAEAASGDTRVLMIRNCLLYTSGTIFANWNATNYTTGPTFEAATVNFTEVGNLYNANPLFVNAGLGNFQLQATSPARNAGFVLTAPTRDMLGVSRPVNVFDAGVDIGALEYKCAPVIASGSYVIGTPGDYATLAAARDALNCGIAGPVRFRVRGGTFSIQDFAFASVPGASPIDSILFEPFDATPVVFKRAAGSGNMLINFFGMQHTTFRNITFQVTGTGLNTAIINIRDSCQNLRFDNCSFNQAYAGTSTLIAFNSVYVQGTSFLSGIGFRNCAFIAGNTAVNITGGSNYTMTGCTFQSSVASVRLTNTANVSITNSNFSRQGTNTAYQGLLANNVSSNLVINNNSFATSTNTMGTMVSLNSCNGPGNTFTNNTISAFANVSGNTGVLITNCSNLNFFHNSIRLHGGNAGIRGVRFVSVGTVNNSINLSGNIISTDLGVPIAVDAAAVNALATGAGTNRNIYFTTGTVLGIWNGANQATLANWQTASARDANSLRVDPQFTSNLNLNLRSHSPAIKQVPTLLPGITNDIHGQTRTLPTDIGADHYVCSVAGTPLSGAYNLGSAGAHVTFTGASIALERCGISGNVVFNVAAETFNETVTFPEYTRAAATDSVRFVGATGNLLTTASLASPNPALVTINASDISFENITFSRTGGQLHQRIVQLGVVIDRVHFTGCTFNSSRTATSSGQEAAIIFSSNTNVDNLSITNCQFNNGTEGIYLVAPVAAQMNISGNNFAAQTRAAVDIRQADYARLEANTIAPSVTAVIGITCSNFATGVAQVLRNRITLNSTSGLASCRGIEFSTVTSTVGNEGLIANNTIIVNGPTGVPNHGIWVGTCGNLRIAHNSVSMIAGNATTSALTVTTTSFNLAVFNNILASFNGTYPASIDNTVTLSSVSMNNNNIFTTGTTWGLWGATNATSFANWQAISLRDANGIGTNPQYISNTADLNLNTASNALNKAAVLAYVTVDLNNNPRSNDVTCPKRDIGAYEYGCTSPLSGTYTVGATGDYLTVAAAYNAALSCGLAGPVTFNIQSGTYSGQQILTGVACNADATNTITFKSQTGNRADVVLTHPSAATAPNNFTLRLNGVKYVTFRDMTLIRSGVNDFNGVIELQNNIDRVVFAGDSIATQTTAAGAPNFGLVYHNGTAATRFDITNSVLLNGARAINFTANVILAQITGNAFINNTTGITNTASLTSLIISDNSFTGSNRSAVLLNTDVGNVSFFRNYVAIAYTSGPITGVLLTGNSANNTGTRGVFNNVIELKGTPTSGTGLVLNNMGPTTLVHNTISVPTTVTALTISHTAVFSGGIFANNILTSSGTGRLLDMNANALARFPTMSNNAYWRINTTAPIWRLASVDYTDLNAYLAATGKEVNSLFIDPLFQSPGNFQLASGSPISGAGVSVPSVSTDYLGLARSTVAPSIGAYERLCPASPLAGTYTIGPTGTYPNFNKALDDLHRCGVSAPVTFQVQNGTYNERLLFGTYNGMNTFGVDFTSQTSNPANVVVSVPTGTTAHDNYVVSLNGTRNIRFSDMSFRRTSTGGTHGTIFALNNAEDIILMGDSLRSETDFTTFPQACAVLANTLTKNLVVKNCGIYCVNSGIVLLGSAPPTSANKIQIVENRFQCDQERAIALDNFRGATIVGNYIYNLTNTRGMDIRNMLGGDLEIHSNQVYSRFSPLLLRNIAGTANITNNLFVNRTAAASAAFFDIGIQNLKFQHNTCMTQFATGLALQVLNGSLTGAFDIRNNIFANLSSGTALLAEAGAASSFSRLRYNTYFTQGATAVSMEGNLYSTTQLADLLGDYGFEDGGTATTTLPFVNPAANNFRLELASVAVRAGEGGLVTDDIEGTIRSATYPSNGAYEPTCPGGALSGAYTVGVTGTYKTFLESVNAMRLCGLGGPVTFTVEPGIYTEQVTVVGFDIAGQSLSNPVVYRGATGNPSNVKITWPSSNTNYAPNYTLQLLGTTAFTFRDMMIERTAGGTFGDVVSLQAGSPHCALVNDSIRSEVSSGVTVLQASLANALRIDSCGISGGQTAIALSGHSGGANIRQNRFYNQNGTVISLGGVDGNINIIGNDLGNGSGPNVGIYATGGTNNEIRIQRNFVRNFNSIGIDLAGILPVGGDSVIIDNNVIYDQINNVSHTGIRLNPVDRATICHNTVVIQGTSNANVALNVVSIVAANSIRLYNNILAVTGTGIPLRVFASATSGLEVANLARNSFFRGSNLYVVNWGGNLHTSVNDWRTLDLPSLPPQFDAEDPLFVASPTDVRLKPCSPLINAGHTTGGYLPVVDIASASRAYPSTPTLGAHHPVYCGTAGLAGTYTVASAQPIFDSPSSAACALVRCGVTDPVNFSIAPGTYTGLVELPSFAGASASDTVVFQSSTGNRADVILSQPSSSAPAQDYVVGINGGDYVTFRNLTLHRTGTSNYKRVVDISGTSDGIRFDNDSLTNDLSSGFSAELLIFTATANHFNVTGCSFRGGSRALVVSGSAPIARAENNKFYGNAESNIEFNQGTGLGIVRGNQTMLTGVSPTRGLNITGVAATGGLRVENNQFRYSFQGISLANVLCNVDSCVIANNTVAEYLTVFPAANQGMVVAGSCQGSNLRIYHNTITNNSTGTSAAALALLAVGAPGASTFHIENNLLVALNQGRGFSAETNAQTQVVHTRFNNNVFFTNSATPFVWNNIGYNTLGLFQGASSTNANSSFENPLFVSAPNNLRVQNGSVAARLGRPLPQVPQDLMGSGRNAQYPTIGAYEVSCPMPIMGTKVIGATGDYATFQAAFTDLSACGISGPVRIEVQSGTYNEQPSLRPIPGTSATDTVLFVSQTGNRANVVLQQTASASATNNFTLRLQGASHVAFHSMTIRRTGTGFAFSNVLEVDALLPMQNIGLHNLSLSAQDPVPASAIGLLNTGLSTVTNLRLQRTRLQSLYDAVVLTNLALAPRLQADTLLNVSNRGIVVNGAAGHSFRIEGNQIGSPTTRPNNCIVVASMQANSGGRILRNQMRFGITAIDIVSSTVSGDSLMIVNNTVADQSPFSGIPAISINGGGGNIYLYHNTIYNQALGTTSSCLSIANLTQPGLKVINNIFYAESAGRTVVVDAASTPDIALMDYNFYNGTSTLNGIGVNWGGTNYTFLATLQAAVPSHHQNAIGGFSTYTPGPNNLVLPACSPAARAGVPLPQVPQDILFTTRSATRPSMGAYEYVCAGGGLAGSYLVGTGETYTTPTDALCALSSCGVSGPVTFNIKPGVYVGELIFGPITGCTAADSVVFQSQTGDRASVVLQAASLAAGFRDYVVAHQGIASLTLRNLTLHRTGTQALSSVVLYRSRTGKLNLINDSLIADNYTTATSQSGCLRVEGTSTVNSQLLMDSCRCAQARNGVFSELSPTSNAFGQYIIRNSRFDIINASGFGMDINQLNSPSLVIEGNQLGDPVAASYHNFGIRVRNADVQAVIARNKVYYNNTGITSNGNTLSGGRIMDIVNNVAVQNPAGPTTSTGISIVNHTGNLNVYHNTVYSRANNTSTICLSITHSALGVPQYNVRNNIFYAEADGRAVNVNTNGVSRVNLFTHNLMFNGSPSANLITWNVSSFTTAASFGIANPSRTPVFEDEPSFYNVPLNLDVPICSPAFGKGIPLSGVTQDHNLALRSGSAPTLGAFETWSCTSPLAGTYSVGSLTPPFVSISEAACALSACGISAPVRMIVAPGVYPEQINLLPIPGANATDTVVLESQTLNPADVVVQWPSSPSAANNYVLQITDADYITLRGLTLSRTGAQPFSRVVNIVGDGRFNRLVSDSLVATNTNDALLELSGSGPVQSLVIDSTRFEAGSVGITDSKADTLFGLRVTNSRFSGQGVEGLTLSFAANLTISDNFFLGGVQGATLSGVGGNSVVSGNEMQAQARALSLLSSTLPPGTPLRVFNNQLVGNTIGTSALLVDNMSYVQLYHNSIRHVVAGPVALARIAGTSIAGSIQFVNNALHGPSTVPALTVEASAVAGIGTINHNLYYNDNGPTLASWGGSPAADLAALQSLSSQDANSLSADPQFTSVTNLLPLSSSPLASAGTPVGILSDIRDSTRSLTTPTIGAYELECGSITITATTTDVTCNGGSDGTLTVTVIGGAAPYQYSLDNFATSQLSNVFTGLPAGSYTVFVKDANNCLSQSTVPNLIAEPPVLVLTSSPTDESCPARGDGSISLFATGGTPAYQYSLNGGPPQVNSTFDGLVPGSYTVAVIDANGCTASISGVVVGSPTTAIKASLRAFLEGPYQPGPQLMGDSLNKPAFQILNNLYNPNGLGDTTGYYGDTTMLATYSVPAGAVDLVYIELRDHSDPTTVVDSALAWLLTDGTLRDFRTGLHSYVSFCSSSPASYYLAVRHRNHLAIMSATPVALSASVPGSPYDMTDPLNVYGPDGAKVVGGKALMYAGNAYDDPVFDWGEINANDFFYVIIDTDFPSSPHYIKTDVNLDGKLNAADFDVVSWNNDNLHRSAVPR